MTLIESYLTETPEKMLAIMEGAGALFGEIAQKKYDRILITGSGTSYHSGLQSREYMQRILGVEVSAVYPFLMTRDYLKSINGKALVVGISQGGSSYSTYNALKLARDCGMETATMAGCDSAFIDEMADYLLPVACGEEKAGAKTKGYYCTKLNLMLMALHMAKAQGLLSEEALKAELLKVKDAAEGMKTVYDQSGDWIERNKERFAAAKEIRLIATSEMYGDVLEGALKMLETLRVPVSGFEFEEFIHGIYNAIDENSTVFILDSGREERVAKIAAVMGEWTDQIYLIGPDVPEGEKNLKADIMRDETFQTYQFLVPIQRICAVVPQLKGIDSAIPKDTRFHMKLGSKKFNQ